MKTIEKIAAGIALIAGLSLATYGSVIKEEKPKESINYETRRELALLGGFVGGFIGGYLARYLSKKNQ